MRCAGECIKYLPWVEDWMDVHCQPLWSKCSRVFIQELELTALPQAIAGFAVIKFCSNTFGENVPILGGSFGPRENNIIQTSATAAGGMSNVFISAIPALYQLGLLDTPKADFWRIVSLTAVGGYFGFFFGTPLRKFFIIYVARELGLIFPSASATAMTIRSMHAATTGAADAKAKMKALSIAFVAALVLRIVSQYCIGILWDWHVSLISV